MAWNATTGQWEEEDVLGAPEGFTDTLEPSDGSSPASGASPGSWSPDYVSGVGTVFGHDDPNDPGVGAWGDVTNDPNAYGVALPEEELRRYFGDPDKARGALVEVTNQTTGKTTFAPIVDKGPAQWVLDRQGPTIDITEGVRRDLEASGMDPMVWRLIGHPPEGFIEPVDGAGGRAGGSQATPPPPEGFTEPAVVIQDAIDPSAPYMNRPRDPAGIKRIVMHGNVGMDFDKLVQYGRQVDPERGFDPGYHFYIAKDGTVKQGAPVDRITNHTKGENSDSIGIVIDGADNGAMPTPEQEVAAKLLVSQLGTQYGIDPQNVIGHGELQPGRREALEGGNVARDIRRDGYFGGGPTAPTQETPPPPEGFTEPVSLPQEAPKAELARTEPATPVYGGTPSPTPLQGQHPSYPPFTPENIRQGIPVHGYTPSPTPIQGVPRAPEREPEPGLIRLAKEGWVAPKDLYGDLGKRLQQFFKPSEDPYVAMGDNAKAQTQAAKDLPELREQLRTNQELLSTYQAAGMEQSQPMITALGNREELQRKLHYAELAAKGNFPEAPKGPQPQEKTWQDNLNLGIRSSLPADQEVLASHAQGVLSNWFQEFADGRERYLTEHPGAADKANIKAFDEAQTKTGWAELNDVAQQLGLKDGRELKNVFRLLPSNIADADPATAGKWFIDALRTRVPSLGPPSGQVTPTEGRTVLSDIAAQRKAVGGEGREVGVLESATRSLNSAALGVPELVERYGAFPIMQGVSEAINAIAPDSDLAKYAKKATSDLWGFINESAKTREGLAIKQGEKQGIPAKIASVTAPLALDIPLAAETAGIAPLAKGATALPKILHSAASFVIPAARAGMDAAEAVRAKGGSPAEQFKAFLAATGEGMAVAAVPMHMTSAANNVVARVAERAGKGYVGFGAINEAIRDLKNIYAGATGGEHIPFEPGKAAIEAAPGALLGGLMGGREAPGPTKEAAAKLAAAKLAPPTTPPTAPAPPAPKAPPTTPTAPKPAIPPPLPTEGKPTMVLTPQAEGQLRATGVSQKQIDELVEKGVYQRQRGAPTEAAVAPTTPAAAQAGAEPIKPTTEVAERPGNRVTTPEGKRGEIISESGDTLTVEWSDGTTSDVNAADVKRSTTKTVTRKNTLSVSPFAGGLAVSFSDAEGKTQNLGTVTRRESDAETLAEATAIAEKFARENNLAGYYDHEGKFVEVGAPAPAPAPAAKRPVVTVKGPAGAKPTELKTFAELPEGLGKPVGGITPPSAAEAAKPTGETASQPTMITRAMERDLKAKGFTDEQIYKMTPVEAWTHLKAPEAAAAATTPPAARTAVQQDIDATNPEAAFDVVDKIQSHIDADKPLGYGTTGEGKVTVGYDVTSKSQVDVKLTSEERKQLKQAEADLKLADTPEERAKAKQDIQDVLKPAVQRRITGEDLLAPEVETRRLMEEAPGATEEELDILEKRFAKGFAARGAPTGEAPKGVPAEAAPKGPATLEEWAAQPEPAKPATEAAPTPEPVKRSLLGRILGAVTGGEDPQLRYGKERDRIATLTNREVYDELGYKFYNLLHENPITKKLGIPVEFGGTTGPMAIEYNPSGDVSFKVNPRLLLAMENAGGRTGNAINKLIGEELEHAGETLLQKEDWQKAQAQEQARRDWMSGGMVGEAPPAPSRPAAFTFTEHVKQEGQRRFQGIKDALEKAPEHEKKVLYQTILDSFGSYYAGDIRGRGSLQMQARSAGKIFDEIHKRGLATSWASEFGRQAEQLRKQNDISESTWVNIFNAIKEWLGRTVERLKKALPGVQEGKFGPELQAHLKRIDDFLQSKGAAAPSLAQKGAPTATPAELVRQQQMGRGAPTEAARNIVRSGFYSRLESTINVKMPKSASLEQAKGIINGAGLKPEEIKWSGVHQAIDRIAKENGGKVPKEELQRYLANEGAVKMVEVTLAEPKYGTPERQARARQRYEAANRALMQTRPGTPEHEQAHREIAHAVEAMRGVVPGHETGPQPRFGPSGDLVLPGGENYREVVLTMPDERDTSGWRAEKADAAGYPGMWFVYDSKGKKVTDRSGTGFWDASSAQEAIRQAVAATPVGYKSTHFPDIPNYVAHSRMNDRTDAEGKPGLFLEEIQSDLHQKGREKGYKEENEKLLSELAEREQEILQRLRQMYRDQTGAILKHPDIEGLAAERKALVDEVDEINQKRAKIKGGGVPDAPFRKDWPMAMFKRALRDAAATGKDWIGWTTGETQAERYDLSKQVDKIGYHPNSDGSYNVLVYKDGNVLIEKRHQSIEEVSSFIGKEMAEKIRNGEGTPRPDSASKTLSGLDLKVGGEGMKGFYDKMLPNEIGKYVRQWGAKVEQSEINAKKRGNIPMLFDNESAAQQWIDNQPNPERFKTTRDYESGGYGVYNRAMQEKVMAIEPTPIWRVEITPAMRKGVAEEGQALFARPAPKAKPKPTPEIAKPYEKTGAEVGELYHGGKQKIKEISPEKFQARDYGFYGKGFYVTEAPHYAKTYGGQVTRLALKPEARVLESTLTPEQASPELIRDVKQALYDAGIAKARERGKEDAFKAEIESITDSPINWKNAVDRFAELQGYDVVKHGAGEIVVKTPSVLQVAKQTPEKAKPKPRPKPETAEEEAGRLAARGAPLPSPLAPTTGGPFTRLRRTVENFFRGTAEQFRRTPGLEFLGNAGLRHQDHLAARKGELTAAVPKVNTREVNEQVAKYWSDQLGPGPSRGAAPLPTHPEAARIVGEQRRLKAEIKARNQSLGIKNDPGDASEYPMMLSKETLQAHQKGAGPHWQRLKDDMVNEGIIPGGAPDVVDRAADQYLKKVTDEFNQGKSINKPGLRLPMSAYELRPGGFISWASHAGEKSALRDAYGSVKYTPPGTPPGVAGKNLFDRARERTKVPKIQRKIDIMEALAYGQSTPNAWSGIINASTNMVTGAYLGNVKSTGKNLLGAIAGNVARWPTSFLKMRAALNAIPEAKERGLLQNDLFDAMDDINHPTLMGEGAGRFASFMLKKHGYPAVEMIARAQGLVGAKDELRAARKAYGNNPKSRKALKFMAWAQRLGFSDPEALIQEAATGGPLADAFLRRAVNRVHGGYAYTDVPLYLSGEHGGLYRQFGKFMTEHTNMVYEDIVKPLLRTGPGRGILPKETVEVTNPATGAKETVKVPGEPLRAAMYLAAFAAAGGLWDFAEEAIWDKASDWEKWSAMFERLGKGEIEVLGDAFTKLGMAAVNLGTFGFAGSFGKAGYEYFTGKSDLEQIALDIPAAGAVKDAVAAVQDFLGRKDWTPAGAVRFSDQILSILSTYRAGKGPIAQALHANNLDVFNSDITAYKIDRANARASMRRMEDALGIERKPHITGVPATAKTALKDKLNDLVATGRLAEARGLIETEKKKLKDDKTKEELMDDLKASTEAKHPLGPGKARRELLMEKAKKLMTPGEYERVKRIQKEYEKNAIKMDLMEDKGASSSQKQELEDKLERQRKQKLYEPSMVEELMSAVGF